jgi:glucose/arabinose dehydrogenase
LTYLKDSIGDGAADIVRDWARGLAQPYGMALVPLGEHAGDLLVADTNAIWRVPYEGGDSLSGDGVAVTGTGVFGSARGHSTRSLLVDPETGAMYVGVGSMSNLGEEPEVKASIQRFDADGTNQTTFASGLRNPTGMAWNPATGALWTMVQERDGMGNELVPDYLTEVNEGDFFGWPYAYTGGLPQPGLASLAPEGLLDDVELPDVLFEAHSSAMDVAFIPDSWPEQYRGDAIAALKGSWNREDPTGYKLVRVFFENGEATGEYENFANGFWVAGNGPAEVWGRPANLEFLADGSLLVADDTGGTIWRIWPPE